MGAIYYLFGALMVLFSILLIQVSIFEIYTDNETPFIKWYPIISLTVGMLGGGICYKGCIITKNSGDADK